MRVYLGIGVLVLGLAGCGGGGGGGGSSSSLDVLSGSYHYLYLGRDRAADAVYSETATFDADGAGGLVFGSGWQNDSGTGAAIRRTNASYQLDGSRALLIQGGVPVSMHGYVSASGDYGVASVQMGGHNPGMLAFAKRMTNPGMGDLSGSWRMVEWFQSGANVNVARSTTARVLVSPSGGVTSSDYFFNEHGAINPFAVMTVVREFTIEPGGLVTLRQLGSPIAQGGVSRDGNTILLGGRSGYDSNAALLFLVRESQLGGVADLSGTWPHVGWRAAMPGHQSLWGSLAFDGSGDGDLAIAANSDGTVSPPFPQGVEYGVSSTSQITLVAMGFNPLAGAAGNGFVVLGGGFTVGSSPALYVSVR